MSLPEVEKIRQWIQAQRARAERLNQEATEISMQIERIREEIRRVSSGSSSLYRALSDAEAGNVVQFEPEVFDRLFNAKTAEDPRFEKVLTVHLFPEKDSCTVSLYVREKGDYRFVHLNQRIERGKLIEKLAEELDISTQRRRIAELREKREKICGERDKIRGEIEKIKDEIEKCIR